MQKKRKLYKCAFHQFNYTYIYILIMLLYLVTKKKKHSKTPIRVKKISNFFVPNWIFFFNIFI